MIFDLIRCGTISLTTLFHCSPRRNSHFTKHSNWWERRTNSNQFYKLIKDVTWTWRDVINGYSAIHRTSIKFEGGGVNFYVSESYTRIELRRCVLLHYYTSLFRPYIWETGLKIWLIDPGGLLVRASAVEIRGLGSKPHRIPWVHQARKANNSCRARRLNGTRCSYYRHN